MWTVIHREVWSSEDGVQKGKGISLAWSWSLYWEVKQIPFVSHYPPCNRFRCETGVCHSHLVSSSHCYLGKRGTLVYVRCPGMSACASVISIRAQGHVQWGKYREKKEVSLKKVIKGGENVCPYSEHGQQRANRGSFILVAYPQNLGDLTPLPRGDICRLFLSLRIVQEERGEGGGEREALRQWWAPWLH